MAPEGEDNPGPVACQMKGHEEIGFDRLSRLGGSLFGFLVGKICRPKGDSAGNQGCDDDGDPEVWFRHS